MGFPRESDFEQWQATLKAIFQSDNHIFQSCVCTQSVLILQLHCNQGDQIGRIFVCLAIVHDGQHFKIY
jgi:hypothetical protein